MAFLDPCDDVLDIVVDQGTYMIVLNTYMQRTFLLFLPLKDLVRVKVGLRRLLMFICTPTSCFRQNLVRFQFYPHLFYLIFNVLG